MSKLIIVNLIHSTPINNSCFITENVYLTLQLIFAEAGATTNIFLAFDSIAAMALVYPDPYRQLRYTHF
jgi:hypothetical protein